MNYLENVPFTRLAELLNQVCNELKEQTETGEQIYEWAAVSMSMNQAFIAVLKKEIAKRLETI